MTTKPSCRSSDKENQQVFSAYCMLTAERLNENKNIEIKYIRKSVMKKIISCLTAAAAVLLVSAGISDDAAMAPYVHPKTPPARVAATAYMPDGQSYSELPPDRKRIVKFDSRTGKELETVTDVDPHT